MRRRSGALQFFGVTTGGSSIYRVFPAWAEILGLDAHLVGVDLPLDAPPERYREALIRLRDNPDVAGALVTTHKLDLVAAAGDRFDRLDPFASLSGEVSCISKGPAGELIGTAKDPITSGLALASFVPPGHWRGGASVLCLGAGGAAVAISLHLAGLDDAPRRYHVTDVRSDRLEHLRALHARLDTPIAFDYHDAGEPGTSEALLADLPPGSLVINATGLGKDRPGSPLDPDAPFPEGGLVWELNYRGERPFLRQARAQREARRLTVEDGWVYFLHGWSQVIAEVYGIELTPELFDQLDRAAAAIRPG